ncbi:hypothetical protein WR25_14028 [Diploscapter pachys]|uniref:TPM domain-containing protein n=1 Tax=Diploscapter pachys TaxID=2018661 RepID=A0A2A2KVJ9_9BILA|nr:hypothetical protein WR25_14028 [Diploscapter pachys]
MLFLLALLPVSITGQDYTIADYPDPRSPSNELVCGLKYPTYICDPYMYLTESERFRINQILNNYENATQGKGSGRCSRKSSQAYFIINEYGDQSFVDGLAKRLKIDETCKKSVLIFLSSGERRLFAAVDQNAPFSHHDFMSIAASQSQLIKEGRTFTGFGNVIKELTGKQGINLVNKRIIKASPQSFALPLIMLIIFLRVLL